MLTLSGYNKQRVEIEKLMRQKKAGVLCDECGTEMVTTDDSQIMSMPPKRRVHCPECGAKGTKYV